MFVYTLIMRKYTFNFNDIELTRKIPTLRCRSFFYDHFILCKTTYLR